MITVAMEGPVYVRRAGWGGGCMEGAKIGRSKLKLEL